MRFFGYVVGSLAAAAAAVYLLIYLYRWEWQRAITCGVLLLIVEVFLVFIALTSRLTSLERQLRAADERAQDARRRLEQTRFDAGVTFRWLQVDQRNRTHVFVPMLMAAGIALAGLAWLLQKLGASTGRLRGEQRLAGRLAGLTSPVMGSGGVAPRLEDSPAIPDHKPGTHLFGIVGGVAVLALIVILFITLSDATKTREQKAPPSAASLVVFEIMTRYDSDTTRAKSARNLWEGCSLSTSNYPRHAQLSHLEGAVYAGVLRPALASHDLMRLRGCISDTQTNRAMATVLGSGQASHD